MENTLSLTKSDYMKKLALGMGVGLGLGTDEEPAWNARATYIITDCVESGLRRFYHCGYKWSFLKPFKDFALHEGDSYIDLPDDFGGMEGNVIVKQDTVSYGTIKFKNCEVVERLHAASPEMTGFPVAAAIYHKRGPDGSQDQKQRIRVFPLADDEYTMRFQYYLNPSNFNPAREDAYAYGGPAHVETILMSIMAIKEERYDRIPNGPSATKFMQLLQASVMIDARQKEQYAGENADRSDDMNTRLHNYPALLINGVDSTLV